MHNINSTAKQAANSLKVCARSILISLGIQDWPHRSLFSPVSVPAENILLVQAGNSHPPFERRGRIGLNQCGRTIPGNWDKKVCMIKETQIFKGLNQRFVLGLDWEHTCLHPKKYFPEHPNLPTQYSEYDLDAFLDRGQHLDDLYHSLSVNGWSISLESNKNKNQSDGLYVNIAREGHLIRDSGGLHRLILAQIIGLSVPVRINVIHSDYDVAPIT